MYVISLSTEFGKNVPGSGEYHNACLIALLWSLTIFELKVLCNGFGAPGQIYHITMGRLTEQEIS